MTVFWIIVGKFRNEKRGLSVTYLFDFLEREIALLFLHHVR